MKTTDALLSDIMEMPVVDSHEHVGSIESIGFRENGFVTDFIRGAEAGDTGLLDLVFSPYLAGQLMSVGCDPEQRGKTTDWPRVLGYLRQLRGSGLHLALGHALRELYGVSLEDIDPVACREVTDRIRANYRNVGDWYEQVLIKSRIELAVKPVHLAYYVNESLNRRAVEVERRYFRPIARVDDFLDWTERGPGIGWQSIVRETGISPTSIEELDALLEKAFAIYALNGNVGLKQLQAYTRTLLFEEQPMDSHGVLLEQMLTAPSRSHIARFQDMMMHKLLEKATSTGMPMQIHCGMANLPHSNPVHLRSLFERYPDVPFVLLHCYPYLSEAGFLCRSFRNVYLDTAWLSLQSPDVLQRAYTEWIGFAPYSKIMISQDATSIEECFGATYYAKRLLWSALAAKVDGGFVDREAALEMARHMLYRNAKRLYVN